MKKYFLGLIAVIMALVCIAFSNATKSDFRRVNVTLSFTGNPLIASEVENESLWWEIPPNTSTCDGVSDKACCIVTDHTNLSGTAPNRTINTSRFTITAVAGASGAADGYIPTKTAGSGAGTFTSINRD